MTLAGNASLFSKVVAPVCVPNSNVCGTLCIRILEALRNSFSGFTTKGILIEEVGICGKHGAELLKNHLRDSDDLPDLQNNTILEYIFFLIFGKT